jgi:tetratricopeptide (TPR) repeat protein
MARRKAAIFGLACAALLSLPTAARAQQDDAPEQTFSRATALAAAGKCDEAIPLFLESHAKDPAVGALLGAADCLERTGDWRAALVRYTEAAELARANGDDRAPDIERERFRLEQRAKAASEEAPRTPAQRKVGLAVIVVGAFGAALGGGLLIMASLKRGDVETRCPGGVCDPSQRTEVESLESAAREETAAGVVALSVGAVALGTGLVLFFTGGPSKPAAAVVATPGGAAFRAAF